MNWQKKLNKTELHHVHNDAGCKTLDDFRQNRIGQKELDPTKEVCYQCRHIAIKLGLES
jgi:hypothetical protein